MVSFCAAIVVIAGSNMAQAEAFKADTYRTPQLLPVLDPKCRSCRPIEDHALIAPWRQLAAASISDGEMRDHGEVIADPMMRE